MHLRRLLPLVLASAVPAAASLALEQPLWHVPGIPPEVLQEITHALRIALHDQPRDAPAYYLPATAPATLSASEALPYRVWREAERPPEPPPSSTPEDEPPTLVLYAPTFLAEGQLLALDALPIDSAEYLLHALLLADLDLLIDRRSPEWRPQAIDRAAHLFGDLRAAERRGAYAEACATFGSHLIGVANEIGRLAARHHDLCRSLDPPLGLFSLWAQLFSRADFAIETLPGDEPGEPAQRIRSLPLTDRLLYLKLALGATWTGVPAVDFASACPQQDPPAQPHPRAQPAPDSRR